MVLLSAILGVKLSGGDNNIFTQISLIVLVGLASKNAILIVEFAREAEVEGASTLRAVLKAAPTMLAAPLGITKYEYFELLMTLPQSAVSMGARSAPPLDRSTYLETSSALTVITMLFTCPGSM